MGTVRHLFSVLGQGILVHMIVLQAKPKRRKTRKARKRRRVTAGDAGDGSVLAGRTDVLLRRRKKKRVKRRKRSALAQICRKLRQVQSFLIIPFEHGNFGGLIATVSDTITLGPNDTPPELRNSSSSSSSDQAAGWVWSLPCMQTSIQW